MDSHMSVGALLAAKSEKDNYKKHQILGVTGSRRIFPDVERMK